MPMLSLRTGSHSIAYGWSSKWACGAQEFCFSQTSGALLSRGEPRERRGGLVFLRKVLPRDTTLYAAT